MDVELEQVRELRCDRGAFFCGERRHVCPPDARVLDLISEVLAVDLSQHRGFARTDARLHERRGDRLADAADVDGVEGRAQPDRGLIVVAQADVSLRPRRAVVAIGGRQLLADRGVPCLVCLGAPRERDELGGSTGGSELVGDLTEHVADGALRPCPIRPDRGEGLAVRWREASDRRVVSQSPVGHMMRMTSAGGASTTDFDASATFASGGVGGVLPCS